MGRRGLCSPRLEPGGPPFHLRDIGNGHTEDLSAADKAAVDNVCAAMKRVVLIVSGRPMNIASLQGEASAIVASWLPGTEGEGVADTLFGSKPFTGRLPETWAKLVTTTTAPLNVGDKAYDPLYPYGWGLRTDSARTRITTVRDSLAKEHSSTAKAATNQLTAMLNPSHWNADGSVGNPSLAFVMLRLASPAVSGTTATAEANANLLVSVARDITQSAVVAHGASAMSKTAALTANAEHDLLVGNPTSAIAGLAEAWQTARHE